VAENTRLQAFERPIFNIKAVVQQTGVRADTLRMWERRYGLPAPVRSPTGRRLYSQRDVEIVRWLVARQAEGMTVGQAVALWRRIESEGREPVVLKPFAVLSPPPITDNALSGLRAAWVAAIQAFREAEAEEVLTHAFSLYPAETVCLEILLAGLAEIGTLWYEGKATVHQEHFATALAMRRVQMLLASLSSPFRPGRILVACPPQEAHSFSLLLLTCLLRRRGWDVTYLGADTPLQQMAQTIQAIRPQWMISAAQYLPAVATLLSLCQAVAGLGVQVGYGGRAFNLVPSLRNRIPGHFLGERLEEATVQMETLVATNPSPPRGEPLPELYRQALARFREREVVIRGSVWLALAKKDGAEDRLIPLGWEVGRHIEAALATGEIGLLEVYLDWLSGFQGEGALPPDLLSGYLASYAQALRRWLGSTESELIAGLLEHYRPQEKLAR